MQLSQTVLNLSIIEIRVCLPGVRRIYYYISFPPACNMRGRTQVNSQSRAGWINKDISN